jgi:Radical SAM superfamily/4Fe-4S single cluster domain
MFFMSPSFLNSDECDTAITGIEKRTMRLEDGHVYVDSLELFAIETCNLRCAQCTASSPFAVDDNMASPSELQQTLDLLGPVFRAGQVKILGGEPLLNPELIALMVVARKSGIFGRIRVATNGVLLLKMPDAFWEAADIVEVSIYPSTESKIRSILPDLRKKASDFRTRLELNSKPTFQLALSDTRIEPQELVHNIFRSCSEAHEWSCHALFKGSLYRCSRVHSLDLYLTQTGVAHESFTELDGLKIDSRPTLLRDLQDYFSCERPLRACAFCLGTSGRLEPHRQLKFVEIQSKRSGHLQPFHPSQLDSSQS